MRDSKGLPRGPSEWGELLYEPQWAKERQFEDVSAILMGFTVFFMGAIVIGTVAITLDIGWLPLVLVGLGVAMFPLGWSIISSEAIKMPFRIYTEGFTSFVQPFWDGLRRHEDLIGFVAVDKVEVETMPNESVGVRCISLKSEQPPGEFVTMELDYKIIDDPLAAMLALKSAIPDKLGSSLDPFIGPGAEDRVVSAPFEEITVGRTNFRVWLFTGLLVYMGLFSGVMMGGLDLTDVRVLVMLALPIAFILFFIPITLLVARRDALESFGATARPCGQAIAYEVPWASRALIGVRTPLPMEEVAEVRRTLEPVHYGHKALVVTTGGDRLVARYRLFESLQTHPDFERSGLALRNRRTSPPPGPPPISLDWKKGTLAGLLVVLLCLLTGLVSGLS